MKRWLFLLLAGMIMMQPLLAAAPAFKHVPPQQQTYWTPPAGFAKVVADWTPPPEYKWTGQVWAPPEGWQGPTIPWEPPQGWGEPAEWQPPGEL